MRMTETQLATLLSAERPSEFAVCFHGVQADRVVMDGQIMTVFRLVGHTTVLGDNGHESPVPDRDMVAIDFVTGEGGLVAILHELLGHDECDRAYPVTIPTMEIMHRLLGGNPHESS